nr:hypothetical protein [Gemmatimonadota bacterium]
MKRTTILALAAALLAVGAAENAQAQQMRDRPVSVFDLGIYAGGSVSSRWYESRTVQVEGGETTDVGESEAYKPGYAPAFGATATYWTTPILGFRLHYGYLPSRLPTLSEGFFDVFPDTGLTDRGTYILNNHLYDLSVVVRPFVMREDVGAVLGSTYFFLGGGGLTSNV